MVETVNDFIGELRGERVASGTVGAQSEALASLWLDISRLFFGGRLPVVPVTVELMAPRRLSEVAEDDATASGLRLRLNAHVARAWGWAVARLLHEAVRVYCSAELCDAEVSYRGHGPLFCREANRIGALLGVPAITPKGRAGGGVGVADWPIVKRAGASSVPASVALPLETREVERLRGEVERLRGEVERLRGEVAEGSAQRGAADGLRAALARLKALSVDAQSECDRVLAVRTNGGAALTARRVRDSYATAYALACVAARDAGASLALVGES